MDVQFNYSRETSRSFVGEALITSIAVSKHCGRILFFFFPPLVRLTSHHIQLLVQSTNPSQKTSPTLHFSATEHIAAGVVRL